MVRAQEFEQIISDQAELIVNQSKAVDNIEELNNKIQEFEQTMSEQVELLANQSKEIEDLVQTVAFSAVSSVAGYIEINNNPIQYDDITFTCSALVVATMVPQVRKLVV